MAGARRIGSRGRCPVTQLPLSLAAPATVLVRWAVASPTWPARADIPVVRGTLSDGVRRDTRPRGQVVRLGELSDGEHAWLDLGTHWSLVARDDRRDG